jgi:hypothetical protein
MMELVLTPQYIGVIDDDFGPYGATILLSPKQTNIQAFIFRLSFSYRELNAITLQVPTTAMRRRPEHRPAERMRCAMTVAFDGECWQSLNLHLQSGNIGLFSPSGNARWIDTPT